MKIKLYYSSSPSLIHKVIFENNTLIIDTWKHRFFSLFLSTVSQSIFLLEFGSGNLDSCVLHETMCLSPSPQFFKIKSLVTRINILLSMKSAQTLHWKKLKQCTLVAMEK